MKKLNDVMLLNLSRQITGERKLMDLAIKGLKVRLDVILTHLQNQKDINMAALYVLNDWANSIESPEKAYNLLYEPLGKKDVDMSSFRWELQFLSGQKSTLPIKKHKGQQHEPSSTGQEIILLKNVSRNGFLVIR